MHSQACKAASLGVNFDSLHADNKKAQIMSDLNNFITINFSLVLNQK
tara:strand:- start:7230 stop:7370 length:141 start_codon:yes stop_codon:yes gene_type:complete